MSRRDPPCIWDSSRSARPLPRGFTDHVTDPFRSIHQPRARQASDELRRALNEATLRAFRNADRFPTFKIFRRPGALADCAPSAPSAFGIVGFNVLLHVVHHGYGSD